MARYGKDRHGTRYGRRGKARFGLARQGMVWRGSAGMASLVRAWMVRLAWMPKTKKGKGTKMIYEWKVKLKTDAEVAGKVFEELEQGQGLTAENLVDVSRPEDAPLHNEFEWDDSIAAEKYRRNQATYLIRNLTIRTEETKEEPIRAYFTTEKGFAAGPRGFESTLKIMAEPVKRSSLLDIAIKELQSFQNKYRMLSELAEVFEAIDRVTQKGA